MTELMQRMIAEIEKLPDEEQERWAHWILEELKSEKRWDKAFEESQDVLSQLADEALSEHKKGQTQTLDPEAL